MHWHFNRFLLAATWLFSPLVQAPPPGAELMSGTTLIKPPVNIHKKPGTIATPPEPVFRKGCGLDIPTKAGWEAGIKANFTKWTYDNFDGFINSGEKSFPMFLRRKFAPNAAPSSQYCDGIGSCTLATCLNLNPTMPKDQQQLAYYAFEKLANIVHTHEIIYQVVDESLEYFIDRMGEFVKDFTSANRLQQNAVERERIDAALHAAANFFLMIAGSALGAGSAAELGTAFKVSAPTASMVSALYVSISGMTKILAAGGHADIRNNKQLLADLQKLFGEFFGLLRHELLNHVNSDMSKLMEGEQNAHGQDIYDLLVSDDFIEPDVSLKPLLKADFEKYFFAVFINSLWGVDRPYILDTNSAQGNCELDQRGPIQSRICLPEKPGRTYWLYGLDRGQEFDSHQDDQATIKAPTGYRKFLPGSNGGSYNLTTQSIVRSSLGVHALPDDINKSPDLLGLINHWKHGDPELSEVPGAFSVPICRNPGGEAITSVWSTKYRNYPCMCGEFGWKNWDEQRDETRKFLDRTGFKWSEDWDDYCRHHNKCDIGKGKHQKHWGFELPKGTTKDSHHVHLVKHKFQKCKKALKHKKVGHPEYDLTHV